MNIVDELFNKEVPINIDIFATNLFYSYDEYSFVGRNLEALNNIKQDKYEITKYVSTNIGEGYIEQKAIIDLFTKKIFARVVIDDRNLIVDILLYSINNNDDLEKYIRIFFPNNSIELDDYLDNAKGAVCLYKNNILTLVKNEDELLAKLGFEGWDYKNKHQNSLNDSITNIDKLILLLNEKNDLIYQANCVKNGLDKVDLELKFTYHYFQNDFYIIEV